jgi:lipopolysaccharide heptosyltransferase II
MKIDKSEIKKILCIKPRGIGDILLSTIIIDNLQSAFPGVIIDYLTEPFAKPVLEDNPNINKVITMGKKEFPLWVALRIRKEKYDLLIDLWSNPRTAQITFLSGVRYRLGYSYRGRRYAYNIKAVSDRGAYHSAEHNLELIKALDIPIISKKIQYYVSPVDKHFASIFFEEEFKETDFVIGIIPAGGWESKRCDANKWVQICNFLHKIYKAKFLILWGPEDRNDADYIVWNLGRYAKLAPPTTLKEMSALINECILVIANDSGPMHISAALGKPTLGIFGPTNPVAHGPYSPISDYVIKEDLFCIKCNKLICPYKHECMLELPLLMILEKIERIIHKATLYSTQPKD